MFIFRFTSLYPVIIHLSKSKHRLTHKKIIATKPPKAVYKVARRNLARESENTTYRAAAQLDLRPTSVLSASLAPRSFTRARAQGTHVRPRISASPSRAFFFFPLDARPIKWRFIPVAERPGARLSAAPAADGSGVKLCGADFFR